MSLFLSIFSISMIPQRHRSTAYISKQNIQPLLDRKVFRDECDSHDSDSTTEEPISDLSLRPKLKVELCRNFLENKICPYKERCKFAHGLEQLLRNSELGQNFRTKKCKVFYDKKHCRFGQRCNFKHGGAQQMGSRIKQSMQIIQNYPQVFLGLGLSSKIIKRSILTHNNTQQN